MSKAIFGRPVNQVTVGGAHIGVDVVTLHKGKVVLFEKPGLRAVGQDLGDLWFPWDYLEYGESPDVAAKRVLKQWGKAEAKVMKLVEVFSMVPPGEDWQLAFQYVAELKAPARNGTNVKSVKIIEEGQLPRMVGLLRRSDIKRYLSLAGEE
jgi:ADP-ribose pyrophosphatase YjhB (NUDIX family)